MVTDVGAYCLTTTCDPVSPTAANACQYDSDGCATNGTPVHWPEACVAFSVQKDGSPLRGITFDTMQAMTSDAYYSWSHADCGGGLVPSIGLYMRSPVNCSRIEYNRDAPNANIWMFRDQAWPYADTSIAALTTTTIAASTGEILDADVEINSNNLDITVGDTRIYLDLGSIIQHESGHALGLAESAVREATMYGTYVEGEVLKRTLSADDMAGICAIYPPGQDRGACDPTPANGFSTECRGAVTGTGGTGSLAGSTGGSAGAAGAADSRADGHAAGCSCRAAGSAGPGGLWTLGLGGLVALFWRRAAGRRRTRLVLAR
jgi:MYXO-CTERM domain-containing protein